MMVQVINGLKLVRWDLLVLKVLLVLREPQVLKVLLVLREP